MVRETDVVRLAALQIEDVGEVLARAFHDDPFVQYQYSGAPRHDGLVRFFRAAARLGQMYGDGVYTTRVRVEGAAIWLPPGGYPMGFVRMVRAGLAYVLLLGLLKGRLVPLARFMRGTNHFEHLHKRDAPPRHWYLWFLGIDPARQGQGIGAALIEPILTQADADGLPCYLESVNARNVPFYKRHGFEVVVEGDLPGGGPRFWTMTRPPQG
jgi:ribosomal protein S18 acetylase RimI-like enzyme